MPLPRNKRYTKRRQHAARFYILSRAAPLTNVKNPHQCHIQSNAILRKKRLQPEQLGTAKNYSKRLEMLLAYTVEMQRARAVAMHAQYFSVVQTHLLAVNILVCLLLENELESKLKPTNHTHINKSRMQMCQCVLCTLFSKSIEPCLTSASFVQSLMINCGACCCYYVLGVFQVYNYSHLITLFCDSKNAINKRKKNT